MCSERDAHRMPPPARTHLPLKPDLSTLKPDEDPKKLPQQSGTINDENDPKENEVRLLIYCFFLYFWFLMLYVVLVFLGPS
jgi:hypothetical protein